MTEEKKDIVAFDGHVRHISGAIPDADKIFEQLKRINWYPFEARKGANSKRTLCYHNVQELPVGETVARWLYRFFREMNIEIKLGGIFGNYYPDGCAVLPPHQDQYDADVVSLSFGATRLFQFRDGFKGSIQQSFYLKHGDVIIFDEKMNQDYWHGIPKQAQIKEPRINLTCFVRFARGNPFQIVARPRVEPSILAGREYLRQQSEPECSNYSSDEILALRLQALEWDK